MPKADHKRVQATAAAGQAATELAVFGAVLIFLLGTIVRSAVGNSYAQNQNFKAMRMAMLASWNDSRAHPGKGNAQVTAHNSAQVLFIEDRLSPDYNKYGDLDRNPYIASGSGTFSYNLLYPLTDRKDRVNSLPVEDVYINGQHFPLAMAAYIDDQAIIQPSGCSYPPGSCAQNQCLRNKREWVVGKVKESAFNAPSVSSTKILSSTCAAIAGASNQRKCQQSTNACTIFGYLKTAQVIDPGSVQGSCPNPAVNPPVLSNPELQGEIDPAVNATGTLEGSAQWVSFKTLYTGSFSGNTAGTNNKYLNAILAILNAANHKYKLFFTIVANPEGSGKSQFVLTPPTCSSHPCKDKELSEDLTLIDSSGHPFTNGKTADMQFDLRRNGDYNSGDAAAVETQLPPCTSGPTCLRPFMGWQWAATAGTSADMVGLDTGNDVYPNYDINGTLKEVTIYKISRTSGTTSVSYVDSEGGDINGIWDVNTCGPKPGLQASSQVLTFTKNGTYLLIKEGKLYNPETGQVVRSVNKRDTIDVVQRTIQLSNNTGRFCTATKPPIRLNCVGGTCPSGVTDNNPVEVCVDEASSGSCFTTANIAQTCYDTALNAIFVRSRVEDRRGLFWMTNTSGELKVH